jgi:hypothetical protein
MTRTYGGKTFHAGEGSYSMVAAIRIPWSDGGAEMRNDIMEHVWHFPPEIPMSEICMRKRVLI